MADKEFTLRADVFFTVTAPDLRAAESIANRMANNLEAESKDGLIIDIGGFDRQEG